MTPSRPAVVTGRPPRRPRLVEEALRDLATRATWTRLSARVIPQLAVAVPLAIHLGQTRLTPLLVAWTLALPLAAVSLVEFELERREELAAPERAQLLMGSAVLSAALALFTALLGLSLVSGHDLVEAWTAATAMPGGFALGCGLAVAVCLGSAGVLRLSRDREEFWQAILVLFLVAAAAGAHVFSRYDAGAREAALFLGAAVAGLGSLIWGCLSDALVARLVSA